MAKRKKKEINIVDILNSKYIYRVELEYKSRKTYEYKSDDSLKVGDIVVCEAGYTMIYGKVKEKVHKSKQRYQGRLKKCFDVRKM